MVGPRRRYPINTVPEAGDWGGVVFRNGLDYDEIEAGTPGYVVHEQEGVFLNYVNFADMRYGGGVVRADSIEQPYAPIYMNEARVTASNNVITSSANAALSADPNSFRESEFHDAIDPRAVTAYTADYDRVGPELYGNRFAAVYATDSNGEPAEHINSLNGVFVRIDTPFGDAMNELEVPGRFDDRDIVHIITENLQINGTPGGLLRDADGSLYSRQDARLAIDPGLIIKLRDGGIEAEMGAQLIAEAVDGYPIVLTSLTDQRYGGGGTFDTNESTSEQGPEPGDWGGLLFNPFSTGSVDRARIFYGGRTGSIEGGFGQVNTIEVHQAKVRVANSLLQFNAASNAGDRVGRGSAEPATIFVRGAQPIIVDNIIRDNEGPIASFDANAMQAKNIPDWGRSTGLADRFDAYGDNHGPLVRENRTTGNAVNGMVIRGGALTTETTWDDTDIVHVLYDEIIVLNHHTYSGLRLQSSADERLVVKLSGGSAGLSATGSPQEINDRIGGTLQIIGAPGNPVVFTSLADDSIGAGFDPDGFTQTDTDNARLTPSPGDWRSILIDKYSNDRNVETILEREAAYGPDEDLNGAPDRAELLGDLAPHEKASDDNLRLGFIVKGWIRLDQPGDVDVYSFNGTAGSEVWIDIDRSTFASDMVVELIDAEGNVLAGSNDTPLEDMDPSLMNSYGEGRPMDRDSWLTKDFYSINPRDPGFRMVLPGPAGEVRAYYVRVRTSGSTTGDYGEAADPELSGVTRGQYEMQIRLRELQEMAGSTVRFADIRYATNGIEVRGLPTHSPLLVESMDIEYNGGTNDTFATAQYIGNVLYSDRNTIAVAGNFDEATSDMVDWYRFDVEYEKVQSIPGINDMGTMFPIMFDLDYADGMSRPDIDLFVFDSTGTLILSASESNLRDDQPLPVVGAEMDNLSRGSFGGGDPTIGTITVPEGGGSYYVAVVPRGSSASVLGHSLARLEPIDSVRRPVEDHIMEPGNYSGLYYESCDVPVTLFEGATPTELNLYADDWNLGDVAMYVTDGADLYTYNPFTGTLITDVSGPGSLMSGQPYVDIAMRNDGRLYGVTDRAFPYNYATNGNYNWIDTGNAANPPLSSQDDEIELFQVDLQADPPALIPRGGGGSQYGLQYQAFEHEDNTGRRYRYAVANANPPGTGVEYTKNLMYLFDDEGHPIDYPGNDGEPRITGDVVPYGMLITGSTITVPDATDTDPPYPTPADPTIEGEVSDEDVLDATQLTILGTDGNQYIFELDSGPDVRMDADGPLVVRDGQTFSLGATTFEFDSGPMLLVDNGSTIFDGDSFTIRPDGVIEPIVFEFDTDDETVIEDAVAIPYVDVHTVQQVMQTVIDVINDQDDLTADGYVTGGVGRIVLTNDASVTVESEVRSIRIDGAYGPKDPANAPIPFEETMAQAAFGNSIVSVVSAYLPNVLASYADLPDTSGRGDRLTFQGAGDYDGTEARATASIVPRAGNFELPLIAYPDWGGAADQIEFTIEYADIGRRAWAGFNPIGNRIVLQVDPFETYATQILTALQIEGHFTHDDTGNTFGLDQLAVFDQSAGALAGGTGFLPAQLAINPNGTDNEFIVEAATPGAGFNGVEVVFHPSDFGGDAASAVYDGTTTLTINYDPFFTTAQTIADEIFNNVPEFTAYLSGNPANNDGTGLIQINTPVAVSAGGFGVPTWEQVDGRHGDLSVTGIDGDIAIPFGAGDTARELMERIAAEIRDSLGLDAVVQGPFIVIDGGGVVEVDPPLEFTGGGPGGDVTGMALIGDQMFAVSDRGGFYEVMDWRVGNSLPESDWGFRPVNPEEGYKHIELRVDSGPNLRYITTITDPDTGEAIPFSGLAPGPENVEQSVYQPMLFATSDDGSISTSEHLYAFDSQTAALQPIFHDGALSLDLGLTTIEGLDFSNIDFNMWHVTGNRSGDAGHGVNPSFNRSRGGSAGGTSFYFGLESPNTISGGVHAAAAADYVDQSSDFLYSYDVPGGAHGTLTTEPFSLAGYEPTDNPLLYFNYYLETQNHPQLDGARVYISSDSGAQWTPLAGNGGGAPLQEFATDGGSGWRQARISLAGYVGLDDLRLRFDFSTGGDLNIGNPATAGAYLRGLEGTELDDGDQFTIDGVTFEFDMGAALYLPNVAGHVIGDGESFTVTAGGDTVTFEFDNPDAPGYTPGVTADVAIDIGYGYMTDDVLLQMRDAVNGALPAVTAEISKHRLMLGGAEQVTQSPGAAIDAEGNGAGIGGPLADVLVPITQDMTAEQVAVAMADAIDLEFAGSPMPGTYVASKQDGSLIHVIGHMVDDPGLLPFANLLPGDSGQFFSNARGQDNRYEGFYIDDIIIGLAERGEMVTGVTPNEAVSLGAGEITAGEYQLEIRRAQDYGVYDPVLDLLVLDDSFHTNDRLIDQLTINAPEVDWIDHLDTFTVSDGWNERTYQFIGREGFTELPGGDASYIPVTYEGDWTAAEVANEIVAAINATENFNIVADSIETSRRVDLFGAAWVAGIDQIFFGDESESVFETDFPSGALSIDQAVSNLDPTAGTQLRDEILGEGVTAVGGASYVGGAASSGFWSDGLRSGILLTTGDASNAAEPNWYPIPNRSGDASLAGDPDLDAEFGVTTLDTSSLEFDFELDGDTLYFDVIFASEQYFDPLASGPDVVAFFLDGKNVGLVPDSDMPISIETINCQTNLRHFFQNTTGPASDLLSYNGYTTFLQMKVQGVEPGTHTIKLAISDVADALTDSAIFIPTGSFSTKPSGRPYRVDRVSTEYGGDPNADIRDQGQLILHSNQILHSAEYGISVDTGTREEESGWAHPSSPGALRELNTRRLVPGITIENNVVAYGEIGGIHFSGDTNPAGTPLAAVPFGRIVNNTVYGSATPATFRSADPTVTTTELDGFDGDLRPFVDQPAAEPTGVSYMLVENHGGAVADAEKSPSNTEDDLMCWAATASNVLEWTGWGLVEGLSSTDDAFAYFQDHWTDDGGVIYYGWDWWFDGTNPGQGGGGSQVDVPGGGFFPGENLAGYFYQENDDALVMDAIAQFMQAGYGAGLSITQEGRPLGHAITVWGYNHDPSDPQDYIGIWVTDSDDSKHTENPSDELRYYEVENQGGQWHLLDYGGSDEWYIRRVDALAPRDFGTIGIHVDKNASPTLMNNIVANLDTGIFVDGASASTVVGGTIYYDTTIPSAGVRSDEFSQVLTSAEVGPLFVNPSRGNFYLVDGSAAIDSSIKSLEDRPAMITVRDPLGIAESPIVAPERDLYGQLRVDDPNTAPPPGMGVNVFIDRGAIDRVDRSGPAAGLVVPEDNAPGVDLNDDFNDVRMLGVRFDRFSIRLFDEAGVGVDHATVISDAATIYRDNAVDPLTGNVDYFFSYNSANGMISLLPAAGIWKTGSTYRIELNRETIRDLAGNKLQSNRPDDTTAFNIDLAGLDFGDAPDLPYPSLLGEDPEVDTGGARHIIDDDYYLGVGVTGESDALQNADATGDALDDGVTFNSALLIGEEMGMTVVASTDGKLDAWIDYNGDGDWDDAGEQIFASADLVGGSNDLTFTVPTDAVLGRTFARFRFSSEGGLSATGLANDGEVEDYRIDLVDALRDFGDAPDTPLTPAYPTLISSGGASHDLTNELYFGSMVDSEGDGQPNLSATGDDDNSLPDEDGIQLLGAIVPNTEVLVAVTASVPDGVNALLQGWIDFNRDGDWDDPGEQVFENAAVVDGADNRLSFVAPETFDTTSSTTFARFRLSSMADLGYSGGAIDGEVEDYRVELVLAPTDFGDAPAPLPTMIVDSGPRHRIVPGLTLGDLADHETNGQPTATADGDDVNHADDEDGVLMPTRVEPGDVVDLTVNVTNTTGQVSYLNAWIDFGNDGVWDEGNERIAADVEVTDGANVIQFTVPEGLTGRDVFARFRLSTTPGLAPTTPSGATYEELPDGEVEDYPLEIFAGSAFIEGWVFDDSNSDGDWDNVAGEPGQAGVTVYLDLDNDGTLDDGEPSVVSMADNPATTADETGSYQFGPLFPGDYTVRQVLPTNAEQTHPGPEVVELPDGSHSEYDSDTGEGWWAVSLEHGETVADANFGNFKPGVLTVGDAMIAEGHEGQRMLEFTVHLTENFSAPVTVDYATADGTATTANLDYQSVSGTIEFQPQGTPLPTWTKQTISTNVSNDFAFDMSGDYLTWSESDGNDWEVYLFDAARDNKIQLTDNDVDDRFAAVGGEYVAWSGYDGNDYEIFLFDYQQYRNANGALAPSDATRQLTHNFFDDRGARVSPELVVWIGEPDDKDVFLHDLGTGEGPVNISDNAVDDFAPHLSFGDVVWHSGTGDDQEIFHFDGDKTEAITDNSTADRNARISHGMVVWEGYDGTDWEIYVADTNNGSEPRRLTNNTEDDKNAHISGLNVVWQGYDGYGWEIYHQNALSPFGARNVSQDFELNEHPRIEGDRIVWHTYDEYDADSTDVRDNWEVYLYDLGGSLQPSNVSADEFAGDWYPQVSDSLVAWRAFDGSHYHLIIARMNDPELTQTISVPINGDRMLEPDEHFYVNLSSPDMAVLADHQARGAILNDDGRGAGLDFGDAPSLYPTAIADNGARHAIDTTLYLGSSVDAEEDGRPSTDALGDDHYITDDEDGIEFTKPLTAGQEASVVVTASRLGRLDAWIDFSGDGDWDDPGEQIFASTVVTAGENTLPFDVPAGATTGDTYARFRLSSSGGLAPTGSAADGEVEDYRVEVLSGSDDDGQQLIINATSGDDTIRVTAGETWIVVINGNAQQVSSKDISQLVIEGLGGHDTLELIGTDHNDVAQLWHDRASLELEHSSVLVNGVADVQLDLLGGIDAVRIFGTVGRETAEVWHDRATMRWLGSTANVEGIEGLAIESLGGDDEATLFGSAGDDSFTADADYAEMTGDGFASRLYGFESVTANAGAGYDTARLYDTPSNDEYVVDNGWATMSGGGLHYRVNGFERVEGHAIAGGSDYARLSDTPGDDQFLVEDGRAALAGEDFTAEARFFERVDIIGLRGGHDTATLADTPGDDKIYADGNQAVLAGSDAVYRVKFFEDVVIAAGQGDDYARLYDTPGKDEFTGSPGDVAMRGEGYQHRIIDVDDVSAMSVSGGRDVARLFDTAGDDHAYTDEDESSITSAGRTARARYFESVFLHSTRGGTDSVEVVGAEANENQYARLAWLFDFDRIAQRDKDGQDEPEYESVVDEVMRFYWL